MNYWLRVRRIHACTSTIFFVILSLVLIDGLYLPLPNLLGGSQLAIPIVLLVPVSLGIVVAWSLMTGDPLVEAVASRPLPLFDLTYVLAIALIALFSSVLINFVTGTDLVLAAGRNTLGYIGLTLIGRHLINVHAAAVLPTGYVLATSPFGSDVARQPYWWAWPLAENNSVLSWIISVSLLLGGAVVALTSNAPAVTDR